MTEHPNAARHRRAHELFERGDMKGLAGLFADDIVWRTSGRGPLAGVIHGSKAVLTEFFDAWHELSGGTFAMRDHDFLGTDAHSVCLFMAEATRNGTTISAPFVEIIEWQGDKAGEEYNFAVDQYLWDDFWNS
jgi:ketosteroid isomerase-like protein